MSRLLLSTGSFAADSYPLSDTEFDRTLTNYLVNTENFAPLGIFFGMLVVAHALLDEQQPALGSLCLAWIQGDRYLLRLDCLTDESVRLYDGSVCKEFGREEVRFESSVLYAHWPGREVGAFFADSDGKVLAISSTWLELAGEDEGNWLGDAWAFRLHPEDRAGAYRLWRQSIRSGAAAVITARVLVCGDYRRYTTTAYPEKDASGRVVEWVGFISLWAVESRKSA